MVEDWRLVEWSGVYCSGSGDGSSGGVVENIRVGVSFHNKG